MKLTLGPPIQEKKNRRKRNDAIAAELSPEEVQRSAALETTPAGEQRAKPEARKGETKQVDKSLESWIWDAACSIRGAKDAPKYKDYILPLVFAKRLCDVFDDELNRIAQEVGGRAKAFKLVKRDKNLVRFYISLQHANPDEPVWSVIRE